MLKRAALCTYIGDRASSLQLRGSLKNRTFHHVLAQLCSKFCIVVACSYPMCPSCPASPAMGQASCLACQFHDSLGNFLDPSVCNGRYEQQRGLINMCSDLGR